MTIDQQAQFETSKKNIDRYTNRQWKMIIACTIGLAIFIYLPTMAIAGALTQIIGMYWAIVS